MRVSRWKLVRRLLGVPGEPPVYSKADYRLACFAVLTGADFTGANLAGAAFQGADLRGANFCGADLRGSGSDEVRYDGLLEGADLTGAFYDAATRWPPAFSPERRGCVRRAADAPDQLPIPSAVEPASGDLPVPAAKMQKKPPTGASAS